MDIKSGVAEITAGVTQIQLNHHGKVNHISYTGWACNEEPIDKELREIANWLSPLDAWITHSDIFRRRQSGTGRWLLESEEFKHWVYGDEETLWCPGIREKTSPDQGSYAK